MSAYPKAVAEGWHPIAALRQLGAAPLARQLMDRPLVVFRGADGAPAVLMDRCPHRNMALSRGRVRSGEIECPYHGWRFNGDGRCTLTPGAEDAAPHSATALPVHVAQGLIWTTLAGAPTAAPNLPHPITAPGFDTFWWPVKPSRARLLDAIENLLDPAHPHFLHSGIVRQDAQRRPVDVQVRVSPTEACASYTEDSRPNALMPRMLEGQRGKSLGRFFPPTIGQVAFEGERGLRLAITVFFTPETQERVRPFAHFATPKHTLPAPLKEMILRAFHVPVLAQDRAALRAQTDSIAAYGPPRYAVGPLDVLFPAVQALMHGEMPKETSRDLRLWL